MNNDLASISDALPKKAPVRQWALGLLALSILVWLSTLYLQRLHPDWAWLGYVKAFAEAACIGGMADWFAVVALFRHPMGVPLPHTAILPAKQAQLARGVANFIGTHFLEPKMIAEQALKWQIGQRVADLLATREEVLDIDAHSPCFLLVMRYRKNGAPTNAVRMPMGISELATRRATSSTMSRKLAPMSMLAGSSLR